MSRNKTTNKNGNEQLPANKQKGKKVCTCCHKEKNLTDYYLSYSPMYSLDQRVPICKECCKSSALNDDGSINYRKLKELLMQLDKPMYWDQLNSAFESVKKENSYLRFFFLFFLFLNKINFNNIISVIIIKIIDNKDG